MDRMLLVERYLDSLDLERLEGERLLTLEGWLEPEADPWHALDDEGGA